MKTSSVAPNAVIMLLLYYEWILQKSILGDGLFLFLSLSLSLSLPWHSSHTLHCFGLDQLRILFPKTAERQKRN